MKSSCCLAWDMEQDVQAEKYPSIMFKDHQQHYNHFRQKRALENNTSHMQYSTKQENKRCMTEANL